jgi:hypothetical protein
VPHRRPPPSQALSLPARPGRSRSNAAGAKLSRLSKHLVVKLPPLEPQHRVFERPGTFLQREATREMLRAAAEALSWLAAKDEAELSTMRSQSSSWFQIQVWSRARGSGWGLVTPRPSLSSLPTRLFALSYPSLRTSGSAP